MCHCPSTNCETPGLGCSAEQCDYADKKIFGALTQVSHSRAGLCPGPDGDGSVAFRCGVNQCAS